MSKYLVNGVEKDEEDMTLEDHIAIAVERKRQIDEGEVTPIGADSHEWKDFWEQVTADFTWWQWKKLEIHLWFIRSPLFMVWAKFRHLLYKMLG